MTYLSTIDKIKILFSSLIDFKGVLIFGILMLMLTILYLLKKVNTKRYTVSMVLSIILVFLLSILSNLKVLSTTFDNFMTVFFTGIYFPSIYLYISTLVIVLFAFLFSIINVKLRRVYKIINRIMFVINSIIFVIILNIIAKNKIDIFSVSSLYTNTNLVGLLEISMSIFLIWIASLITSYVTNSICDRIASKKEVKEIPVVEKGKKIINYNPEKDYVLIENLSRKLENVVLKETNSKPIIGYVSAYLPESITLVHDLVPYDYTVNEVKEDVEEKEKNVSFIEVEEEKTEKIENTIFDDILNGRIPVNFYQNDKEEPVYNISNPQEVYESHYNEVKLQDLVETSSKEEVVNNISIEDKNIDIIEDGDIKSNTSAIENKLSIEEITEEIKNKKAVENLIVNTVSLNELVDDEALEDVKVIDKVEESSNGEVYTVEDYRKILGMLNSLKKHSIDHNVTIDDAVALSLISNYSLDDCLKFKDILESSLN